MEALKVAADRAALAVDPVAWVVPKVVVAPAVLVEDSVVVRVE